MAKDAKDAKPKEEGAEAPKKKSKKLLIIILASVLVLVLAGGGAFMLLKKSDPADDEETAEETSKSSAKKKGGHETPPVFVNLEPFTVNLIQDAKETSDQYLQVVLSLELEDPVDETPIKSQMPKIRNNLTLLLSAKKASELLSKEGKERLAENLKDEINSVVQTAPKKDKKAGADESQGPVKAVLFTSFIIQ